MKPDNADDDSIFNYRLKVVKSGLRRWYDDGAHKWSKALFQSSLKNEIEIDDPHLQAEIHCWAEKGYIEFIGTEDCYFILLGYVY